MNLRSFFADVAGGGIAVAAIGTVIFAGIVIVGVIVASVFIIRYIKKKNANNQ